ncbi:hypothetical protein DSL72_009129 [Monilinia vaccinii-corymbosi]|uniref:Metallo-beta-lactamase domain-containing protein n=1 Tax=Monilinia vaccinii-corymbosi TaxID=61207 RepID=A0A8A3PNI0_9HELO|nr:hypothetical protein DSL72_009129 [Monilinia vaccinii-corymbosi]
MTTYPTDDQDFQNASAGLVGWMENCVIQSDTDSSVVVWDNQSYLSFINDDATCPPEINPSLFRQSQLCVKQGLFEVVKDKIYQVRGLDTSNMTFVETVNSNGVVVIDPLCSVETAKQAIGLYQGYRRDKNILAMIYTHSHADHFGGGSAVVEASGGTQDDIHAGTLGHVFAPADFLDHAVSENVYAGNAMGRRSVYMYGDSLEKNAQGQVGSGLGMATSTGAISLIPPTVSINTTNEVHTVDGLEIVFQMTPGTEAPSEMNFHFPQYNALCMAENATHNLHNIQTLRGALVRDARVWSRYSTTGPHLIPKETMKSSISSPCNAISTHLHNETLRLLNDGQTGIEIAEDFKLPPNLEQTWNAKGYYGSVSHNVKAIYNRYMGWFDGNPAHLWEHPPVPIAQRYVACMGGIENVIKMAKDNYICVEQPDWRFAATLLSHAVFSDQTNADAKTELSKVFTHLGYGAENATWRNFYLCGAKEVVGAVQPNMNVMDAASMMALSVEQLLDTMGIRINGPNAFDTAPFQIDMMLADVPMTDASSARSGWRVNFSNAAMTDHEIAHAEAANAGIAFTVWASHRQLVSLVLRGAHADFSDVKTDGDAGVWSTLCGLLEPLDAGFAIVTPEPNPTPPSSES